MKRSSFIFSLLTIFLISNIVFSPALALSKKIENNKNKTSPVSADLETKAVSAAARQKTITEEEKAFATAVNVGDYAYDITKKMSYEMGTMEMPLGEAWRPAGSEAEHEAAEYLKKEMVKIGLKNVRQDGFPVQGYTFSGASVQVLTPNSGPKILATGFGGVSGTGAGGLSAPIVYVGLGGKDDYDGKNVKGKIVLVDVDEEEMNWLHLPYAEAESRGAIGLIVHWLGYQGAPGSVMTFDSISRPSIPAVGISHQDFDILKTVSESGEVTVKMISNVKIDKNATSYNVVGYIPGVIEPERLIVVGAHYDKWWYGAADNSGGVGQMLSLAKALIDSNYKPTHTIAFVAFGAEEYGWTDTNFDWLIGSYSHLKNNYPDWPGKTLAYFNLDDSAGLAGAKTISAGGSPEMYDFRKDVSSILNDYFSKTLPWSAYYLPAQVDYGMSTTYYDTFSFASFGIPTMSIVSTGSPIAFDDIYHTQLDNMDIISAESLGMSTIANGLTLIRLDHTNFLPYNFVNWANDFSDHLSLGKLKFIGVDATLLSSTFIDFKKNAYQVWSKIRNNNISTGDQDKINLLLLEVQKKISSSFVTVGGYDETLYPHEQYQNDAFYLKNALDNLSKGNLKRTLNSLQGVYGLYEGVKVSRSTYKGMIVDRHNPNRADLFWATNRLSRFVDFYEQYALIQEKGKTEENIILVKNALDQTTKDLKSAIAKEASTFTEASRLLLQIDKLLP